MKNRIAHLLVRLAEWLCPTFELKPTYEAKEIAIAVATIRTFANIEVLMVANALTAKAFPIRKRYRRATITATSLRRLKGTGLSAIRFTSRTEKGLSNLA